MNSDEDQSRELALLQLVERHRGTASWYRLEQDLAGQPVPRTPKMMDVLKALAANGFVVRSDAPQAPGMDRWAVTERGARWLEDARRCAWPLGPLEAADLARELGAPEPLEVGPMRRFLDCTRKPAALLQLLAAGLSIERVGRLTWWLADTDWLAFCRLLREDPALPADALFAARLTGSVPSFGEPPPRSPASVVEPAPPLRCHIVYSDGATACGEPTQPHDCLAWRDERVEAITHRITFLLGPGGVSHEPCNACTAAHAARQRKPRP